MIGVKYRDKYAQIIGISAIILIVLEIILLPIIHVAPWKSASLASYAAVILTAAFGLVSFRYIAAFRERLPGIFLLPRLRSSGQLPRRSP